MTDSSILIATNSITSIKRKNKEFRFFLLFISVTLKPNVFYYSNTD